MRMEGFEYRYIEVESLLRYETHPRKRDVTSGLARRSCYYLEWNNKGKRVSNGRTLWTTGYTLFNTVHKTGQGRNKKHLFV